MSDTDQLLHEIESFIGSKDMAETTFGRKAVNDGKLVPRLKSGSTVTLEKASRIRDFIRENAEVVFQNRTRRGPRPIKVGVAARGGIGPDAAPVSRAAFASEVPHSVASRKRAGLRPAALAGQSR